MVSIYGYALTKKSHIIRRVVVSKRCPKGCPTQGSLNLYDRLRSAAASALQHLAESFDHFLRRRAKKKNKYIGLPNAKKAVARERMSCDSLVCRPLPLAQTASEKPRCKTSLKLETQT